MSSPIGRLVVRTAVCTAVALLAACAPEPAEPPVAPSPAAPPSSSAGPDDPLVRYVLGFEDAPRHLVNVTLRLPAALAGELFLPAWTPGSYKIRDYARHLEGVTAWVVDAEGDRPAAVEKIAKDRWRLDLDSAADSGAEVVVRYRVYARERTVRTNWVDADLAMLNGAPTFLAPVGADAVARSVRVELPEAWSDVATALDPHPSGETGYFVAADLDTLVDSPIVAGELLRLGFTVEHDGRSVPHEVIHVGDIDGLDLEWSRGEVETLTRAHVELWDSVPYERYLFLNVVTPGRGGLEHRDSTLMLVDRWRLADEGQGRLRWLGLVSHELFHVWNGKRLRPEVLGPFDYARETYTPSLGVVEGFTTYYGPLLLRRAGLWDDGDLYAALSRAARDVQESPGRQVRSLADSSFDAWIKHYQRDENLDNTAVDYYSKGALAGWVLDAAIRRETGGRRSLDGVMRTLYAAYSGDRGYPPEAVRVSLVDAGGPEVGALWDSLNDSTVEIDYQVALDHFGLRWGPSTADASVGWLGFEAAASEGVVVERVPRGTPAFEHGLNVGDEILAIDDHRVRRASWDDRRAHYPPGTEASLLIDRDGRLRRLPVVFGEEPAATWALEVDPVAGARARVARRAWLDR